MAKYNSIAINGTLVLPFGPDAGNGFLYIIGGPFDTSFKTKDTYNINLKAEGTKKTFDAELPIEDFSIPEDDRAVRETIKRVIEQAMLGKILVTGCMGGMGRTGLFLAILAKAFGIEDPIKFVRANYYEHAVERQIQEDYINNIDVSWVRGYIKLTYLMLHQPAITAEEFHQEPPAAAASTAKISFWDRVKLFWFKYGY